VRQELRQLRDRAGLLAHDLAAGAADRSDIRVAHVATPRAAAQVAALAQRHEEGLQAERVAARDEVDGVAHERDAYGVAGFDQPRQLLVTKVLQPGP